MWWDSDEGLRYLLKWRPDDPDPEIMEGVRSDDEHVDDGLPDDYHLRFVYSHWNRRGG